MKYTQDPTLTRQAKSDQCPASMPCPPEVQNSSTLGFLNTRSIPECLQTQDYKAPPKSRRQKPKGDSMEGFAPTGSSPLNPIAGSFWVKTNYRKCPHSLGLAICAWGRWVVGASLAPYWGDLAGGAQCSATNRSVPAPPAMRPTGWAPRAPAQTHCAPRNDGTWHRGAVPDTHMHAHRDTPTHIPTPAHT